MYYYYKVHFGDENENVFPSYRLVKEPKDGGCLVEVGLAYTEEQAKNITQLLNWRES